MRLALLTAAAFLLFALRPWPAAALSYYWGAHPDKERLVFVFDRGIPTHTVARSGRQSIDIRLPADVWEREAAPQGVNFTAARLVKDVVRTDWGLRIELANDAFSVKDFTLDAQNKLVVDVLRDPAGAEWTPPAEPAAKPAPVAPTPETPNAPAPDAPAPTAPAAPQPAPPIANATPAPTPAEPTPSQTRQPMAQPEQPLPNATAPAAPEDAAAPANPFYSVPYTYRATINPGGVDDWKAPEPPAGPKRIEPHAEPAQAAPPETPGVRQGIVNGGASYVNEAMPAKPATRPEPQTGQEAPQPPKPQEEPAGGHNSMKQSIAPPAPEQPAAPAQAAAPAPVETAPVAEPQPVADAGLELVAREAAKQAQLEDVARQKALEANQTANNETTAQPAAPDNATPEQQAPDVAAQIASQQPEQAPPPSEEADRLEQARSALYSAKAALNNGDYDNALDILEKLRADQRLQGSDREDMLYTLADAYYAKYKESPVEGFDKTVGAISEAINFDPNNKFKVPSGLLRLGMLNMKVGNLREAEAYFNVLQQRFPDDLNVPLIYYYWGEHYYKTGQYQKAADQFQIVVQDFPDSKYVREASVGLARSLHQLGYDKQAFEISDYIEKRWPRFYVEYPPFLQLSGDVAFRAGNLDKAKGDYWTYYNLDPNGDESDIVLARLGDIYVQQNKLNAARELYQDAAGRFPDRDGGLIAKMRLAEEGIYDQPSVEDMFSVFDRPYNERPRDIYKEIVEQHPKSKLAPLAQIKLAIWNLWNHQYLDALDEVQKYEKTFDAPELNQRAKEVAVKAFQALIQANIPEENYERIMRAWDQYPILRANADLLDDENRVSLALAFFKSQQPDTALTVLEPFFRGPMDSKYSEMALQLAVSILLANQAWDRLAKLGEQVELWELSPKGQKELDYARALAYQNLNQEDKAAPLWAKLVDDPDVQAQKRAYPLYYLAQQAKADNDLALAYDYATTGLSYLLEAPEDQRDNAKIRDLMSLLTEITESGGRLPEALQWAERLRDYIKPTDPDWPALQYRTAQLHRKNNDYESWRTILKDLSEKQPQSLYGRMAASELRTYQLEQAAQKYSPVGQM